MAVDPLEYFIFGAISTPAHARVTTSALFVPSTFTNLWFSNRVLGFPSEASSRGARQTVVLLIIRWHLIYAPIIEISGWNLERHATRPRFLLHTIIPRRPLIYPQHIQIFISSFLEKYATRRWYFSPYLQHSRTFDCRT